MITELGKSAINTLSTFKKYCTESEYEFLEKGVKEFDTLLTGVGFYALQAETKLKQISKMDFETFQAVMYVYFGKTLKEFQNV